MMPGLVTQLALQRVPLESADVVAEQLRAIEKDLRESYAVTHDKIELAALVVWLVRRDLERASRGT